MKPVTCAQMRELDEAAINEFFIPGLLLMENAGRGVCQIIQREYPPRRVLICVGKGNNGGDGLVVARHLMNRGYAVQILLLEDPARLKADPLVNYTICRKMRIPVIHAYEKVTDRAFLEHCRSAEFIVDAILGVGIKGPVQGLLELAINGINRSDHPVVSIDIPSGIDADTGLIQGAAVRATWTVTLALPKQGLYRNDGPAYAGKIEVVDIGIPRELTVPFQ